MVNNISSDWGCAYQVFSLHGFQRANQKTSLLACVGLLSNSTWIETPVWTLESGDHLFFLFFALLIYPPLLVFLSLFFFFFFCSHLL